MCTEVGRFFEGLSLGPFHAFVLRAVVPEDGCSEHRVRRPFVTEPSIDPLSLLDSFSPSVV